MDSKDRDYLIVLCEMRVMDVESQAREQAKQCSMTSVRRVLEEADYLAGLMKRLKAMELTGA